MIRFPFRILGYGALALAFAMLVIDGTATIAASGLRVMPLGQWAADYFPVRMAGLPQAVSQNLHPLLWDPVMLFIFNLPGWLALGALGIALLALGRKPEPAIGFSSRP